MARRDESRIRAHSLRATRPVLLPALALIPFLLTLALAYRGIDFGFHWDEDYNKMDAVAYSLDHDFTLLPDGYIYPGVNYWLTFGALAPELWRTVRHAGPDANAFKAALLPVLRSDGFRLRLRRIYAFVAALAGAWIYLALLSWRGNLWEALFGSLLFASSGEVVYHARWIAPDLVLTQFGALTLLLLIVAWKRGSWPAACCAAAAAGLGCGTKYPGGLLIVPVLTLPLLHWSAQLGWRRTVLACIVLIAIFGGVYIATTPGTLLQPIAFFKSLDVARQIYGGGFFGYAVRPGGTHFWKIAVYFATAVFSTFRPEALLFFIFMIVGIGVVIRENFRIALVVLVFPVLYLLFFSRQPTMIDRNYLILAPFAAIFAARGLARVADLLPGRLAKAAFAFIVAALLIVNTADQIRASSSIVRRRDTASFVADFSLYAEEHPRRHFLVSQRLATELGRQGRWPGANLRVAPPGRPGSYDEYASFSSETVTPRHLEWRTNRPGTFVAVFGPREVNLDYYTGWIGDERVITLSPEMARETGVLPP